MDGSPNLNKFPSDILEILCPHEQDAMRSVISTTDQPKSKSFDPRVWVDVCSRFEEIPSRRSLDAVVTKMEWTDGQTERHGYNLRGGIITGLFYSTEPFITPYFKDYRFVHVNLWHRPLKRLSHEKRTASNVFVACDTTSYSMRRIVLMFKR